jgi:hypothetical protein
VGIALVTRMAQAAETVVLVGVEDVGNWRNGPSDQGAVSDDGLDVAFRSGANNLVPPDGDGNNLPNVFLRDLESGTSIKINPVTTDGRNPPLGENDRGVFDRINKR